ncbi:MAG: chromosome segregation protein SMC [Pseudomonadota bacterium]
MKFVKLRCLGFKSFVEPTEFFIEDGLTGIVGPNGCGKSNLVEALRWVMGESSYKNMRASGMDDVIFSGSGGRPSRNTAEVTLFLDNTDRTAPAAFNDADELQISRRIEREAGSQYRINGRDVRAKDVHLLFADASTGARSPSMVGQGRIGELISAKPQARRALLEEAAGISGLHSRRHEAELRLRAADQNLERLEDVLGQLDSQLESLKRQARQANRYRILSAEIRKTEALLLHLRWSEAKSAEASAQSQYSEASLSVGDKAEVQAESAKEQAIIASRLPELRDNEAKAAAALQRLTIASNQIEEEVRRIETRKQELAKRVNDIETDITREENIVGENKEIIQRLVDEQAELEQQGANVGNRESELQERFEIASAKLNSSESHFAEATSAIAREQARKSELERKMSDAKLRVERLETQLSATDAELEELKTKIAQVDDSARIAERVELLERRAGDCEADALEAEKATESARFAEQELRTPLDEAKAELDRIETEARTLNNVLNSGGQDLFPAIVEKIKVESGYELALGASLGEDLDIPANSSAPAFWGLVEPASDDPSLPDGVKSLAAYVNAPRELARCLAQIGIVDKENGDKLQSQLMPGQCLVSIEGDLWRWDGFVSGAEAPTAAAQRLAQKNRLAELDRDALVASQNVTVTTEALEKGKGATAAAIENERQARETWRTVNQELTTAREELSVAERSVSQFTSRQSSLQEARQRITDDLEESRTARGEAESSLAAMPDISALEGELADKRNALAQERSELAVIRAEVEGFNRENQARTARLSSITSEMETWSKRAENATSQIAELNARKTENAAELQQIEDAPAEMDVRRRELLTQVESAEAARREAADTLAKSENQLAEADKKARDALAQLSETREARARAEERVTAAVERREETEKRIRDELDCAPHDALGLAEMDPEAEFPEAQTVERSLEKQKSERERLGAVNLRAEAEQAEISERRDALISERDDLVEAIKRLRQGIASLNREGRERLLEAFDVVNGHFQRLFTHLFGGGTAELQLIESDDPLEAGLEILARPPGKRPQTMTLLSGGEQALTALALIFAVFLTNPAPICVLDEVDAPLDDHNVERFCNLMDEMASTTDTRFVIITHNPITMARMKRLFGVTMAERGVSQMVSVNLEEAERIREAG